MIIGQSWLRLLPFSLHRSKRDLQRLLLKLEELQEEAIRRAMERKGPVVPGMSEEEKAEARGVVACAQPARTGHCLLPGMRSGRRGKERRGGLLRSGRGER